MLKKIHFENWNQFGEISIELNEKITILTGVNGSGKSTILRILGKLIGWDYSEIAKPTSGSQTNFKTFSPNFLLGSAVQNPLILKALENYIEQLESSKKKKDDFSEYDYSTFSIGTIDSDIANIDIRVPKETDSALYNLSLLTAREEKDEEDNYYNYYLSDDGIGVKGVNIPSHRMPYFYNTLSHVHARLQSRNTFYNEYMYALSSRQISGRDYNQSSNPLVTLKSSIITAAMYSNGNPYVGTSSSNLLEDLINLFRIMLPESFKFETLRVEDGEIVLITTNGNILLDSVSSGIGSLIDLTWQIFMGQPDDLEEDFIVLIDEVENHLHPSMQRNILPKLISAFPTAQFIVTTHSPLVVNSCEDAFVYALKYDADGRVYSTPLNFKENFNNSMEVLREVLEVPVTMPVWAEERLEKIVNQSLKEGIEEISFESFSKMLEKQGLTGLMPDAIKLLEKGYHKK